VTILGQELDFVNLRTETYTGKPVDDSANTSDCSRSAEHSRIPSISATFGTPLEDALRRDFTINSLFFNINLMCIEDITQRGLQDLRAGQY
jgi:tRNA nucleotidyltransferase (CCA-adding enzyme)